MKEFREKLEKRIRNGLIFFAVSTIAFIVCIIIFSSLSDIQKGISIGFYFGTNITSLYNVVKMLGVLKNEKKLKEMYIKENDERSNAIIKETCQTTMFNTLQVVAIAALISGFINLTICLTLTAVLLLIFISFFCSKIYYTKKM